MSEDLNIKKFNDVVKKSINDSTLYDSAYPKALATFIENCEPPITIALQGEWGSGKTTMMNMVLEQLKIKKVIAENGNEVYESKHNDIEYMPFNAWLFSQFNLGSQLPLILLTHLSKQTDTGINNKFKESLSLLKKAGISSLHFLGKKYGGTDNFMNFIADFTPDDIDKLENLKKDFENAVSAKLKDKSKLLIFIDDIDRVAPDKAVELLEAIKLFCECKKCVFILAVDYDVILKGAREKFGKDKGQAFFDKIIQVPFNMPTATNNFDNFIGELVNNLIEKDDEINKLKLMYKDISELTIGNNPRSIKRLLNSFVISDYVAKEQNIYKNISSKTKNLIKLLLYYLLCIENYNSRIYTYIVKKLDINDENGLSKYIDYINCVVNNQDSEEREVFLDYCRLSDTDFDFEIFEKYCEILQALKDNSTDSKVMNMIFKVSSITAKNDKLINNSNKEHYLMLKKLVVNEIEKYKNDRKFTLIANSNHIFVSKVMNDLFICKEFDNNSTNDGDFCGYYIGGGGLIKNSWNKFVLNIGVKDIDKKGTLRNSLMTLQNARNKLKSEGILDDLIKNANEEGLTIFVNNDDTLGKNNKYFLTVKFNEDSYDERVLKDRIDKALDFIITFEKELFRNISI